MAVLDYLGVHFSRILKIFDGVGFQIWILSTKMAFWRAGYTSQMKEHLSDYLEGFVRNL